MGSLLKSSNNAKKQTPSTVANNDDDFTNWALHSGVWLEPEENPIIQQALATVKSMTELVLPAEWRRVHRLLAFFLSFSTIFRFRTLQFRLRSSKQRLFARPLSMQPAKQTS
ncbi:hypothetical protein BDZ89DRAFT_995752, partial [Hymenopellis radicata]